MALCDRSLIFLSLPLLGVASFLLALPAQAGPLDNLKDPKYWSNLCTFLSSSKKLPDATNACGKAIEQQTRNPELWSRYSDLHLTQAQYPEALAAATQALTHRRENSQALTQQCIAQAHMGQPDAALAACNQALKLNKNWGNYKPIQAMRHRAIAFDKSDLHQEALALYNQVLALTPTDALTLTYRCEILLKLQRPQEAQADCQTALAQNPDGPTAILALYSLGLAQNQQGQYESAIATFDRTLAQDPKYAAAWTQQAWAMAQLKQYNNAVTSYGRSIALQPSSRALVGQCLVLNQLKQYEPALASCQKAIDGDGQWWAEGLAEAFNQQSHALSGLNRHPEALAAANRAIGLSPNYTKAWSDRAVIHWQLAQYPEALADCEKASQLNPQDPIPWFNRGRTLTAMNQWPAAIEAYNQALKLDGNQAETWANLSAAQWNAQQFPAALESADRSVTVNPKSLQGWYNRAIVLTSLGRYAEARESYERAIALSQTQPQLWANYGVLLMHLKDYPRAQQALTTALQLDPKQPTAQQALTALTTWQQQTQTKR
jgi:tetratricopeptide (TPR) repeat protein